MSLLIRPERASDHAAVAELVTAAFAQETEAQLIAALRSDEAFIPGLSLVAEQEGSIAGHILFTKIQIVSESGETHESLALAPMAVRPGFQKQGIGAALIRHGLKAAKALGYASVIVLGHAEYYPKFGFVPASKWKITSPFEVPDEVFMGLELREGGLDGVSGRVKYAKAFEMF